MRKYRIFTAWLVGLVLLFGFASPAHADKVTMNFTNADIRAVIKFVAEFSGKNFLVDNRVKGKVTIISPTAIPREAAYQVFLSSLEVNGFTTVPSGKVTKIIPLAEGKQKAIQVRSKGSVGAGDALVTQIITLGHADSQQLVGVLRPLVSPNGNLVAFVPANALILTDASSNVIRIIKIIKELDISDAIGFKIIALKHASAEKLAQTLNQLYAGGRGGVPVRAGAPAAARGISNVPGAAPVKIIAHPPGNMLIIIASGPFMAEVVAVINRLDVAPAPDSGRLYVRYLKNANAEDAAKVLNELIGGATSASGSQTKGPPQKTLFAGEVKVVADPATNALLITADKSDRDAINSIIDKLDIRRLQVLVETMIVEISADVSQQFGIEFQSLSDPTTPGRKVIGGTNFPDQAGGSIVDGSGLAASGLVVGLVDGTLSFGGTEILNLGALLRALESNADVNVLSTPNLLTMDNEEAKIIVGENVPFITGTQQTTAGLANPFQTIERQDVGITLKVTPQISAGDSIRMELVQEISAVTGGTAAEGGLITSKRSIETVVLSRNEQIIVLGGLIQDDTQSQVQRVPCLGSVPVLGEAFTFTEIQKTKKNLMVFLRPHIIRSQKDIDILTQKKYINTKKLFERPVTGGTMLFPLERKKMPENMDLFPETKNSTLPAEETVTP